MGDLEFQERAFDRARGHYEKALQSTESESNINELKQSLIYIHVELEEYEEAINLSNQILDNNTDNADIYFNVGVIYQRLSNTFYEQMIQDYKNIKLCT